MLNPNSSVLLPTKQKNIISFSSLTIETRLFPPQQRHKYLSSEVDSSSLIHFHACTYLDWIPVKNNYNGPPRSSSPPSLLRGVCCQDCLDDFLESGCPHLCLISTTIRPSTPELMRRHLQPGLEDPTDKDAIQPLHKCSPPDPLGRNRPRLQNKNPKSMRQAAILISRKWFFVLQPGQECKLENKMRLDMEPKENENITHGQKLEGKPGSTMCNHRSFHLNGSL